jgi:hypothetical protein
LSLPDRPRSSMKSSDNDRRCDHAVISSPRSMNWNLLPELRLTPTRKPTFSYRYNRLALTLVFECLGITSRSEQKPTAKGAQCDSCVSLPLVNFVGDGIIVQCRLAAIEHFAWRDKMLGASYAHLCHRGEVLPARDHRKRLQSILPLALCSTAKSL